MSTFGGSLTDLRKDYSRDVLDEREVDPNPIRQFAIWFEQAREVMRHEPNAMTVATASANCEPSARMLLLKGFDERGFVFFTSYISPKAHDLDENPRAALLFYWPELERQVRISGQAERLPREESDAYFQSRPRGSQIAAIVSRQSQPVESRQALADAFAELEARYDGQPIPRPEHWGGYRVRPVWIEFWQGRPNRLHDRIRYTRQPDGTWRIERLMP